jgi:hypothetical protein
VLIVPAYANCVVLRGETTFPQVARLEGLSPRPAAKTLAGYRHDIDHYIVPRIGRMRLQALRPAVISKLYPDLSGHGGRDGRPLSATTISHIHRTLRKALADAVDVDQLLAANPAARSKRPKSASARALAHSHRP